MSEQETNICPVCQKKIGFDVKPLGRGNLKNIPFEKGGGYRINYGGDGYFQYHPKAESHHKDEYYKITDYYVIAAKILTYLYKKYKCERLDADYITPLTKDFPIPEEQLKETIVMMEEQGFIKGDIVKDAEGEAVYIEYHSLKITPAGIDYMTDNGKIRKAIGTLKEAATIMGLFR